MGWAAALLAGVVSVSGIWSRMDTNDGRWDELAPLLRDNGFDTVFYMAAYGPVVDGEGLLECLEACRPLGIDVHAWVVMWRTDLLPRRRREELVRESRIQVHSDGTEVENWLNPTDPENVALMAGTCLDIASDYPVDGIHLDYIRWNYYLSGYSEATRRRFLEETGLGRVRWPEDCLRDGRHYDRFMRWRAGKITEAVRAVRDSLGRLNRVVPVSAAVLPRTDQSLLFGQMWGEWLDRGLLDFAVTMSYTRSDSQLTAWASQQLEVADGSILLCGIGAKTQHYLLDAEETRHQMELAEELGYDGWVVYKLAGGVRDMLYQGALSPCRGER
jgi:uncharacterized lipoprotein YddW (UPF0748 family)